MKNIKHIVVYKDTHTILKQLAENRGLSIRMYMQYLSEELKKKEGGNYDSKKIKILD